MRESILKKLYEDGDYTIYNPSSVDWSTFPWSRGYIEFTLGEREILKPYYISAIFYGTNAYEDIIMLVNNIPDTFKLRPGITIRIPNLDELKDFLYFTQQNNK